jgi:2-polyprenyl-6-methoxyphenol hydroxylase-like FAD-dependent oxidoreductase
LFGREKPTYSGYTAWRAVVKFTATEQLLPGETLGRGARFGQMPLSNRRVYWYATKNAPEGERSMHGEMAVLRQTFHGWHAPIEALINSADESLILRNDIYDRPALSEWGEGRVTLLGDAAHPMTPNLGQGACQAIEDAVALGRALQENKDAAAALRAYEARRIPRANEIVKRSRQVGRIGQWQNPLAVWTRNFLMKSFGAKMQAKEIRRILDFGF